MKVILTESQYITIMEDIKKEQYKKLVLGLLKTLFGKLSIEDIREEGKLYKHTIFDQNGENIADIYLERFGNKGCKKDLTLSIDTTERLEGYVPYFRHKIFSKVLIDYVYDELGIKCDCVQYEYDFKSEVEVDDDGEEYEYKRSNTRKYNVKKKKKIKESTDKNKKFLSNVMGVDFTDKIEQVTSVYDVPYSFYRKGIFTMPDVASYLNKFGPMYIFELDGRRFIYQDRSRYESFISEDGIVYEDKIPEQLGIDIMGLRFSDIIDIYFNEGEI
jgi:hypothetical protein